MYRYLLLIIFIITCNIAWAKPLDATLTVEYFQGELHSHQQLVNAAFTPTSNTFNLDIHEPKVWLKLTITNDTGTEANLTLLNYFAYLSEQATLYDAIDLANPIAMFKAHSFVNNEDFIANIWQQNISVGSNKSKVIYLYNYSTVSQIYKFSLQKVNAVAEQLTNHNMFSLFIIAILLTLALYNLTFYFYGGGKSFLFYFIYLLNGTVGLAYLYGLLFQFSETYRHLLYWFSLTALIVPALLALYTKYTLEIKKYSSSINDLLTIVVVICLISLCIAILFGIEIGMKFVPISFTFSFVVIAIVSCKMILIKHPLINVFIFAYLAYVLGMGLTICSLHGFLPFEQYQFYASGVGLMIEGVLFSYILHYKSKSLQLEVTRQIELQRGLKHLVEHDYLTQVTSRRAFEKIADNILQQAKINEESFSLMFIDIDEFKLINDNYGHQIGDRVLQHVANSIKKNIRSSDIIARVGGDEFVVLLPDLYVESNLNELSDNLIKQIQQPILDLGVKINIGCSIGIAIYPLHGDTIKKLLTNADVAMYQIKGNGKNNSAIFKLD